MSEHPVPYNPKKKDLLLLLWFDKRFDQSRVSMRSKKRLYEVLLHDNRLTGYESMRIALATFGYGEVVVDKVIAQVQRRGMASCFFGPLKKCEEVLLFLSKKNVDASIRLLGVDSPWLKIERTERVWVPEYLVSRSG